MVEALRVISSMATRLVLTELVAAGAPEGRIAVDLESVGGVDAAQRVRAGEAFDAVVLAADAIDGLVADGHLVAGSRVDLVRSGVAVAVKTGAPRPDIGSEDALRRAVLAARAVGYSTGPSGVHLARVFAHWGVTGAAAPALVQASPGVPVGALVARGEVDLGFQQLAELIAFDGIDVVGPLPAAVQIVTTFAGALATTSRRADAVRALLASLAAPATAVVKRRYGMEPT